MCGCFTNLWPSCYLIEFSVYQNKLPSFSRGRTCLYGLSWGIEGVSRILCWCEHCGSVNVDRMYGSRGSNMDWINEKFGCHCHVEHGPVGEWLNKPWLWAMRGRETTCSGHPLLCCSFFIVALDVIASITANISQQPPFLTATALTIHNLHWWQHFRIYSLLVPIIHRIQHYSS